MKALLQYLEPGYELPSRKRIMKLLHARYEKAIPILKAKLLDSDGIALVTQWKLTSLLLPTLSLLNGR